MKLRSALIAAGVAPVLLFGQYSGAGATGAPVVQHLSVSSGPYTGGTETIIAGTGFSGATNLLLTPPGSGATGDVSAQCPSPSSPGTSACFIVDSDTQITAVTPAHPDGTVDVQVQTGAGTSATSAADQFTFTGQPAPQTVQLSVHAGPTAGGTQTLITSDTDTTPTGFRFATAVHFGTVNVTSTPCPSSSPSNCFTVDSDSQITAYSPPSPGAGSNDAPVDVTVTTAGGTSPTGSHDRWTWASAPTLAPSSTSGADSGGTAIALTGTHFQSNPTGGYSVTEVDFTNTTNSADLVRVTNGSCPAMSPVNCFTVTSQTAMTVYAPATDDGVFYVQVFNPGGGSGNSAADEYTATPAPPTVSAVTPSRGNAAGGYTVVITGGNFTTATKVQFGGAGGAVLTHPCAPSPSTPCFTVDSAGQITVRDVPSATAAGATTAPPTAVDVVVTTTGGSNSPSSSDQFTYYPTPMVNSVSPSSQPQGTTTAVAVNGSGFYAVSEVDLVPSSAVTGSTIQLTATCGGTVTSACFAPGSATALSFAPPANAPTGAYGVLVVTPGGNSTVGPNGSNAFSVLDNSVTPAVTSLSTQAGPLSGGQTVVLTGTSFTGSSWAPTQVNFGSLHITATPCPATPASACFTANSATQITAVTPSSASQQVVNVTVTIRASDGSGPTVTSAPASGNQYEFAAAPSVTLVAPSSGGSAGMTQVAISGTNFSGTLYTTGAVTFGTVVVTASPCPGTPTSPCFTVNSATSITVYSPAHAQGVVDVTVTTPGGTSAASANDLYQYTAPQPVVTAVAPAAGPVQGGTTVTITGSGFTAATDVFFGSIDVSAACPPAAAAGCFTVISDSQIDATTPAASAGTVDVRVLTAGGESAVSQPADRFEFAAAPSVTSITPSAGSSNGLTRVAVAGTHFSGATYSTTSVSFGASHVTAAPCPGTVTSPCFTVASATSIIVYAPAHAPGSVDVTVTTPGGTSGAGAADHFLYVAPGAYTSLQPFRVLDTRSGSCMHCGAGALGAGEARSVTIATLTGPQGQSVPANALAVVVNVTAVSGGSSTYITVYPGGATRPGTSNLNAPAHTNIANLVVTALGGGNITVFNHAGSTDVIVDVEGYFAAPSGGSHAGQFHPLAPARVCDTRKGSGTACSGTTSDNALGAGAVRKVVLTNLGATASAAALNLTAVSGTAGTFLSVSPPNGSDQCSTAAPSFSNLNVNAGAIQPNRVIVPVGAAHDICVYNHAGAINIVVDVNGWFATGAEASSGTFFYAAPPARLCDTRAGSGTACSGQVLGSGSVLTIAVGGAGGPAAIIGNATAVGASGMTYFTLYPADVARPLASDVNAGPGQTIANLVIVQLASSGATPGAVDLYNSSGSVQALLDITGWFQ